eukprot:724545-Prymnesium_polylepis.3
MRCAESERLPNLVRVSGRAHGPVEWPQGLARLRKQVKAASSSSRPLVSPVRRYAARPRHDTRMTASKLRKRSWVPRIGACARAACCTPQIALDHVQR